MKKGGALPLFAGVEKSFGGVHCLSCRDLLDRGIVHGFTMQPADFSTDKLLLSHSSSTIQTAHFSVQEFLSAIGARRLLLLKQVHGDRVVHLTPAERRSVCDGETVVRVVGEGDALFVDGTQSGGDNPQALCIGVRAADCLPVLIIGKRSCALVHAGWRGLAHGILGRTLAEFASRRDAALDVIVGPAAGAEDYEVGAEVVAAIGETAVFMPVNRHEDQSSSAQVRERFILSQAGTAFRQCMRAAESFGLDIRVSDSGISTISNGRFHSFRRDRDESGRGLGFIVV